jgi:hypothetical protein
MLLVMRQCFCIAGRKEISEKADKYFENVKRGV